MNTTPSISVIIPIFQAEDTLSACVQSVLSQTFRDWELLLVDDGSTDKCLAICNALASADPRLHVLHQENQGPSEARYTGVKHAQGTWLTFVDADDTLPPTALATLFSATNDATDIVLGNGYTLRGEHRTCIPMQEFRHLVVRGEGTIGLPWGSLYRRSVLAHELFDVPTDIRMGEDYIFWLRLAFHTERPVQIVYQRVYTKGEDHACSTFRWTASYAARIHELRKGAIPEEQRLFFLSDMIADRIDNLFTIAVTWPKKEWIKSAFYQEILSDLQQLHMQLPFKRRLFLRLPSRSLRRMYSKVSNLLHRCYLSAHS